MGLVTQTTRILYAIGIFVSGTWITCQVGHGLASDVSVATRLRPRFRLVSSYSWSKRAAFPSASAPANFSAVFTSFLERKAAVSVASAWRRLSARLQQLDASDAAIVVFGGAGRAFSSRDWGWLRAASRGAAA
jgi:hypothetical protein